MCKEMESIHEWQKEKLDELVKDTVYEHGKKDGIEQITIEVIKTMLENKYSYEEISKITRKSIVDIKEIEKSLKD